MGQGLPQSAPLGRPPNWTQGALVVMQTHQVEDNREGEGRGKETDWQKNNDSPSLLVRGMTWELPDCQLSCCVSSDEWFGLSEPLFLPWKVKIRKAPGGLL